MYEWKYGRLILRGDMKGVLSAEDTLKQINRVITDFQLFIRESIE
jgi:hypothetical protein